MTYIVAPNSAPSKPHSQPQTRHPARLPQPPPVQEDGVDPSLRILLPHTSPHSWGAAEPPTMEGGAADRL